MNWTKDQVDTTLRKIVERSMTDPSFRELALRDARSAINSVSAEPLPTDFKVKFVDNARADMTVVLPDAAPANEVAEEELAEIAGGTVQIQTNNCLTYACPTAGRTTLCNPGYTKKPGSPAFCPN